MTASRPEPFVPDYATPPGESLRQTLEALQMTQAELAERTELSTKHINQIIQGVASVTPETALALERVTGAPADFWSNLEANYQLARAKQAEAAEAEAEREWVKDFPLAELRKRGVLSEQRDYYLIREQLLAFFGVASRGAWERLWQSPGASFRRSRAYKVDDYATACWLRLGELEALRTRTGPFDPHLFRQALTRIRRSMTAEPDVFEPLMRQNCAQAGVAVVMVAEVKGSRAHGAVRWLAPGKALLQLSLRLKWEDVFWFSFFHEAGHVLLHGKRESFIEYPGAHTDDDEGEADLFAQRTLIPDEDAQRLPELSTDREIEAFAKELRLPPAVVVGRLQHDDLLPHGRANHLRRRFELVETVDATS